MSRVVDHSDDFIRDLVVAVEAGLAQAAFIGAESARASMPGAGASAAPGSSGRLAYRASTAGQPPGVRTARLKNDITDAKTGRMSHGFGTQVKYGRYLELGATTPGGQPFWKDKEGNLRFAKKSSPRAARMAKTKPGRIAARPFLRPVLLRERVEMENAFAITASKSMARSRTARLA